MVLVVDGFENTELRCPFSSFGDTADTERYSYTTTSFTTTSYMAGASGTVPIFSSNLYGSHTMKKIIFSGTGIPTDEFGNQIDTFVCTTCGFRVQFYGSTSRTTLGI